MARKMFRALGVLSVIFYGQPQRYDEQEFQKLIKHMTRNADLSSLSEQRFAEVMQACKEFILKKLPILEDVEPLNWPYTEDELDAWELNQTFDLSYFYSVDQLSRDKLKQLIGL